MLLSTDDWPFSARSACSSVRAIACSLFNTYESTSTDALVAAFKLSISLAAPVMTVLVRAVQAVQAVVHEKHRKSVIDYHTEVRCGILHPASSRSPWQYRRSLSFVKVSVHDVVIDPKPRRTSSFSIAWQGLIHYSMQVAMLGWSSSPLK